MLSSHPHSDDEIAEFRGYMENRRLTLKEIAERYKTTSRNVIRWGKKFGCERHGKGAPPGGAGTIAAGVKAMAADMRGALGDLTKAVIGQPGDPANPVGSLSNPMNDPQVQSMMKEIESLAFDARSKSDMVRLQQTLGRMLTLIMARAPVKDWQDLGNVVANFYRLVLQTRRTEADIPQTHDPAALRQDAARQMMMEVGSVLSLPEQKELGRLLQMASDRLVAKTGKAGVLAAPESGALGSPTGAAAQIPVPPVPPASGPGDDQDPTGLVGAVQPPASRNPW